MENETYNAIEKNPISKLERLMKNIKFAMMTTVDPDGSLFCRPMVCQQIPFDGNLWFLTEKTSGKILSLLKDRNVNLSFSLPSENRFISVSGCAVILQDKEKAKELWNPLYKAWFPKGLEDPDLVLLRVRVENAEYWDSPSSLASKLINFAKVLLDVPQNNLSQHERLTLH